MSKSSSGDLYWIENQYVTANIWKFTWKRSKNEYSPHNVSVLSALKKLFCMSSNLPNSISLRRASPPGPPIPGPYPGPTSGLRRPQTPNRNFVCASKWPSYTPLHPVSYRGFAVKRVSSLLYRCEQLRWFWRDDYVTVFNNRSKKWEVLFFLWFSIESKF